MAMDNMDIYSNRTVVNIISEEVTHAMATFLLPSANPLPDAILARVSGHSPCAAALVRFFAKPFNWHLPRPRVILYTVRYYMRSLRIFSTPFCSSLSTDIFDCARRMQFSRSLELTRHKLGAACNSCFVYLHFREYLLRSLEELPHDDVVWLIRESHI